MKNYIAYALIILGGLSFGREVGVINLPPAVERIMDSIPSFGTTNTGTLTADAEAWVRGIDPAYNTPANRDTAARAMDMGAAAKGTKADAMTAMKNEFYKMGPDAEFGWADFKTNVTKTFASLRDSHKLNDTAKSHAPYFKAIAKGIRNVK